MKSLLWSTLCVGLLSTATAHAQAQLVPVDAPKGAEKTDVPASWNPFLGLTSTINLVSNSNVVGQVDGFSTLFGLGLTGGADYVNKKQVLRTSMSISESFARTPVIDEFVKTNDVIKLEGIYSYFATKDMGAYGRLSLQTAAFPADDVRGTPTSWVEKGHAPGDPNIPLNMDVYRQRLAGSFAPFTINESVGGFAEPLHKDKLSLSVRMGIGGRHTFADSVLLADDDKATPEVELLRLSNVHQLGLEGFAGASGKMRDGKLSYKAGFSILFPFVNNDADNRAVGKLTRIGFEGSATFNMYSWMSLVYSLSITRDPQLFPAGNELTQIQNNLLLTFQLSLVKKKEAPAEKTKEQLELEEAKAHAEAAEKRATEAEKKLQDAQTAPAPTPTPAPDATPAPAPTPTPAPAP